MQVLKVSLFILHIPVPRTDVISGQTGCSSYS